MVCWKQSRRGCKSLQAGRLRMQVEQVLRPCLAAMHGTPLPKGSQYTKALQQDINAKRASDLQSM